MTKPVFCCAITLLALASFAQAQDARIDSGGPAGSRGALPGRSGSASDPKELLEAAERSIRAIDEAALKEAPKRDYKVEIGPPAPTKLFRADPKLLANKFVATLTMSYRETINVPYGPRIHGDDFPEELRRLDANYQGGSDRSGRQSKPELFKFLVERCSPDHRPGQLAEYLTSADCDRDVRLGIVLGPSGGLHYTIYAPTAEEAEARAAAILRLYDCGASRPLQQYSLAEGRKRLEEAKEPYAEYQRLSDAIRAEEERLAQPSEISADILSQLKAQKVMVAIELAGLIARVKACDSMLSDPKSLPVSTLQSISDMKVRAEIERIGVQEKLDKINAFVTEGDRRAATQKQIETLTTQRSRVARTVSQCAQRAASCAALVEYYAPRELVDNKITISPVEWTN
jgi:hypothetical protein